MEEKLKQIDNIFSDRFDDYGLTEHFLEDQVTTFIDALGINEVVWAMTRATERVDNPDEVIKYFCGICWNKKRNFKSGFELKRKERIDGS